MKLVGLVGKKRSGKDTAFDFMREILAPKLCYRYAFADALKDEVVRVLRGGGWRGHRTAIDEDKDRFRAMLQWWGTEFRRGLFGDDYWVRRLEESIAGTPAEYVVVTDVRFLNEAAFIRDRGGCLVRVVRPCLAHEDAHASEVEQDQIQVDLTLMNHSLAQLRENVQHFLFNRL